jgi:hypothetical protein
LFRVQNKYTDWQYSSSTDRGNDGMIQTETKNSFPIILNMYVLQKTGQLLTLLQTSVSKVRSDGNVYRLKQKKD